MTKKDKLRKLLSKLSSFDDQIERSLAVVEKQAKVAQKQTTKPRASKQTVPKPTRTPVLLLAAFEDLKKSIAAREEALQAALQTKITELSERKVEVPDYGVEIRAVEDRLRELIETMQENLTTTPTAFDDTELRKQIKEVREDLSKLRGETATRLSLRNEGGGGANRRIRINGSEASEKYIDINFKPGTNVTLSKADNNTTKEVEITITASDTDTGITQLTGDVTAGPGSGSQAATLATVNANVGTFGSATKSVTATVNAKGLVTAISEATITPAASSITGAGDLTKADDTNVTLTLGGTPTGSLLKAVSITAGWTGTLAPSRGGTGQDTSGSTGVPQISGGTWSVSTALANGTTGTTQAQADNSTKIATTAYVDEAILGQRYKEAVKYGTVAALPTVVYSNGSSGVGATLTAVSFGALSIDSNTPSVNDRVLVKNQADQIQNGIYAVTTVGAVATLFVLTRATDFDQSSEIQTGDSVFITSGTVLASTLWAYTGINSPTIGTNNITWAQVSADLIVGSSAILSGTNTRILYNNNGTLGEYTLTGSGTVAVMQNTPTLITPVLGVATATSINGLTITSSTGTLTITNGKTLTQSKTMQFTAADDTGVYTFPTGTKTLLAVDGAGTSLTGIPYSLTGTSNQVNLSAATGNITFSLPQSIATSSTPQFARLGLGAAADGTIPLYVAGSGQFGTGAASSGSTVVQIRGESVNGATAGIKFGRGGSFTKYGEIYWNATDDKFYITSNTGTTAIVIDTSQNVGIGNTSPQAPLHVGAGADAPNVGSSSTWTGHFTRAGQTDLTVRDSTNDIENRVTAFPGTFETGISNVAVFGASTNHATAIVANNSTRVLVNPTGVIKIAGSATRGTTEGTNHLDIFDGTAPVGTLANGISLYSTSGELRVMDSAGNATLLSPHEKGTNNWIYHSKDINGRVLKIDVEKMFRAINEKFGWDFVHEFIEK